MRSDRLEETLLPKRLALPVFCSDPLSSVAYATEQILLVLGLGGLALLDLTPWVAVAVVALLAIVVASYRQTCHAYPNGGGAYAVSRANLGENASLTAASALLIDYVLTVAVSVVAGVAAITSAFPSSRPRRGAPLARLRRRAHGDEPAGRQGVGRAFAIPTYGFVASFCCSLVGVIQGRVRRRAQRGERRLPPRADDRARGLVAVFLVLRAFASGLHRPDRRRGGVERCPRLRGAEEPERATTLLIMGVLAITMFAGITALAIAATCTWPRTRPT